jgi:predicted Zn finger-like uncharacterized protein
MIVSCPNCNSSYRAPDDAAAAARLKCPRCGLIISNPERGASPAPAAVHAPAPIPFDVPDLPARAQTDPVGREWDAKVTGPLSTVPAPDLDPLADLLPPPAVPVPESELAGLGPAITTPRDPFYEANPLVVEQPPADAPLRAPRTGYASQPAMAAFAQVPGSARPQPAPDPFAAISLQVPDRSARPFNASAASPPPRDAGPLPTYPGESSDPFANISLVAPAAAPVAGGDEGAQAVLANPTVAAPAVAARPPRPAPEPAPRPSTPPRAAVAERPPAPFPPPPRELEPETPPARTSPLAWVGLGAAALLLLLSATFAAWQYELLPLDPAMSVAIARLTGLPSPLIPSKHDAAKAADEAMAQARAAQQRGALATASVHYRRVLALRPDDTEARAALAACYLGLGDRSSGRSADTRPAP